MTTLPDLSDKTALVTGANSGIGLETARALAQAGATVVLACRSAEKAEPVVAQLIEETGNDKLRFEPLDLADLDSVRAFAERWLQTEAPIDLLINNAGLAAHRGQTKQGFEIQFGVNHLGHFLLTELLLERVKASAPSRIVNVASAAHFQADAIPWDQLQQSTPSVAGLSEYAVSKLCNVLHAAELARRLEGTGVSTASLHPGVVATNVWRRLPWPLDWVAKRFMIGNEEGAQTTLHCCVSDEVVDNSGWYFDACAIKTPSKLARDTALQDELDQRSRAWVGLA